jgi:hypothetical protein
MSRDHGRHQGGHDGHDGPDRSEGSDGSGAPDEPGMRGDALGAVIRRGTRPPPVESVDWSALHARITAAAAALLEEARPAAAKAGAREWWQPLAGWSSFGIPVAAAASVLLVLAAGALEVAGPSSADATFRTIEEELAGGLSAGARLLLADPGSSAVLDVALFAEGEDW